MKTVDYILDEDVQYQKLLPINSLYIPKDQLNDHITKSDISISNSSNQLSNTKNTETTKSELIQRILDSLQPTLNFKSSSNSTTNTSLSPINQTTRSYQSENLSNEIYIYFKDKNQLGIQPDINDLLEEIEHTKNCSCYQMKIIFQNHLLNQQLSYKQKQSILRIILRRQQIFDRYFL